MTRSTTADRGPVRQRLIAAREARGLDRAQAAAGAGISLRYLTMLEEGEYPLVSDPAYLSPFIRRYAAFLDLPPEPTVVAFLNETEVAERVAAASVPLPPQLPDAAPERRGRPWLTAAMILAVVVGAGTALVDVSTAGGWLASLRPTIGGFGARVDRVAAAVGRFVVETRTALETWVAGDAPPSPVELARSSDLPRPIEEIEPVPAEAPVAAVPTVVPPLATVMPPAATPMLPATPVPAATVPAATTPIQLSAVAPTAVPTPADAQSRGRNRLELLATARQVFVWATIDGAEPREVELRRGESASFEARRELLITIDDAGGVLATLNGKRLPPLGASGYGKRNIRIPLAANRSASR